MANKVMSLHDAVEKYVCDNDVLCLGGFTTNRKPYAAVYEILRQGKTGFVGWSGPAGGDWDALIGEGRVRAYINCYTANSGYTNVARRFRAAIEKGELTYEDYSQDVLMLQLQARTRRIPASYDANDSSSVLRLSSSVRIMPSRRSNISSIESSSLFSAIDPASCFI